MTEQDELKAYWERTAKRLGLELYKCSTDSALMGGPILVAQSTFQRVNVPRWLADRINAALDRAEKATSAAER